MLLFEPVNVIFYGICNALGYFLLSVFTIQVIFLFTVGNKAGFNEDTWHCRRLQYPDTNLSLLLPAARSTHFCKLIFNKTGEGGTALKKLLCFCLLYTSDAADE